MSKYSQTILFVIIIFVLPFSGEMALILETPIIISIIATISITLTQPAFSADEMLENKSEDKYSVLLILIFSLISLGLSVFSYRFFPYKFDNKIIFLGYFFLVLGVIIRILAIRNLGSDFTATINSNKESKISKQGVYSIIRHPSYLGAFLFLISVSIILNSIYGLLFSGVIMFIVYYYRIKHEEIKLVEKFNSEYEEYQKITKKFFPFIW